MTGAIELAEAHAAALASTRRIVDGVGSDQWERATPCADWNVRELTDHVVSGNFWAGELMAGKTIAEVGDRLDGDVLGADPLAAYDESARIAADAFGAPGAMEAPAAVSYGPVPGEIYAGHRFLDVLIHGWDLAQGTGQRADLDPELVEMCWAVITPQLDMLEASGMFGHGSVEPPVDADRTTALLAALGRRA